MLSAVHDLSARELLARYAAGDLSPVEVVDSLAGRADRWNALTTTAFDRARDDAVASGQRHRAGEALPLDGVPVVVKDLVDTAGLRTTYGSRMFADHVPTQDAPVVAALRAAGALVVAKAATHEFAWGITTDNEHFGPTRNPWAPDRVPGGSSGGSAAALAAYLAPLAIGTDTVGSIRIPAAFCGVVGLRPTHGTVDAGGAFPLAPSFDVVGPMARTVEDVRLLHGVLAPLPSVDRPNLVVGVCQDLDQLPLGDAAVAAMETAAGALAESGARVVEVAAPGLPPLFDTSSTIVLGEGLHTHRRADLWPGRAAEYGRELRTRLELAEGVDLDCYLDAQADRGRVVAAMARLFDAIDVLLSPVSTVGPVPIGTDTVEHAGRRLSFREAVMTCTAPQSLAGLPACTAPAGRDADGLPVGVQLTGWRGADALVLDAAERLQRALD